MKKLIFSLIIINFCVSVMAQEKNIFDIPGSIPVPCWVNKINWSHPNVFVIDSTIHSCSDKMGIEKRDEDKNEVETEMNEEPYMVAYIRWRRYVQPFVQPNGELVVDSNYYKKRLIEAIEKQQPVKNKQKKGIETNGALATTNGTLATTNGTASWAPLGPKQTYFQSGGGLTNKQTNMYSIAFAKSNPNILYAGSETGVLFRSVDKGLHWTSINDALTPGSVKAIAVSPSDPNTVYAYSGSLIKTTDGGATWAYLSNFGGDVIRKIDINPTTGRILVAAEYGIYYSDNAGSTWTASPTDIAPGTKIYDLVINLINPSIVYAVSASSATNNPMLMYRSTNGGSTFTAVTLPPNTYSKGARIAVTAANGNYIYCFTLQNDVPKVLKSTDAGITWLVSATFTGTGLKGDDVTNGLSNGQGYYDLAIMVSPTDVNQVIVGTTSAFKSTDGGVNFTSLGGYLGSFNLHPDTQCMVVLGNDAFISTDGGVNYSTDFFTSLSNFSVRNNGLTGSDYWGFGQGWGEDLVVGGRYHNGNAALYEKYGDGNALSLGGGEDATGHVFPSPGKTGVVGLRDLNPSTRIIPSSLAGAVLTADVANTLWPSEESYGEFSSKLMVDPRYSNVFYVGNTQSLWKSQNSGASYVELKNFGTDIWRFDLARTNPDIIVTCTTGGIYKTMDGGTSWIQLSLPAGTTYQYYNSDISINPTNENEMWLSMAKAASDSKVFKSVDGGSSWTNYTGTALQGAATAFILAQGGTNEGVYIVLNSTPAKVYYRDASMNDWMDYSSGLPQNFTAGEGGIIFYRDNKLRLAGSRGIWESPLYSSGSPVAQPMANKKYIACRRDTVNFGDYSMLNYAGAAWQWSFPGASYMSSATEREPKVLYASPGNYGVTLSVTDAQGRTSSRTIANMINFTIDNCSVDTVAGKSLIVSGTNTTTIIGTANINSNTFSLSCWIKPSGKQQSFAQLISHDNYPGSTSGFGLGFAYKGYVPNLNLCYTDGDVGYGNSSSLVADTSKWNFVVLTYSPTGVIIYLNGIPETVNSNSMAAIDLSQSPFYINRDIHSQYGYYNGLIDEVKIYNYTLSQDEVRQKSHLIQSNGTNETGLVKYMQFNSFDATSGSVYELVDGTQSVLASAASLAVSTAPVATGVSYLQPNVNAGGQYSFSGTGMDLYFPSSGTYPNGDLVGFRLNSLPDSLADANSPVPTSGYFIVTNYGSNASFSPLQKIVFSNLPISSGGYAATDFKLYKRPSTAYLSTEWGNNLGASTNFTYGANGSSKLEFGNSPINSFSQFTMSNSNTSALPVTLVAFAAQAKGNAIEAYWLTTHEDLKNYELERSTDGINFSYLTTVSAQNNALENSYSYLDAGVQVGNSYYYRLKMINMDGKYNYSVIRSAMLSAPTPSITDIAPNPSKGWSFVTANITANTCTLSMYLYDGMGKMVYRSTEQLKRGITKVMLNYTSLASGTYFLKIYDNSGMVKESKLIILK